MLTLIIHDLTTGDTIRAAMTQREANATISVLSRQRHPDHDFMIYCLPKA